MKAEELAEIRTKLLKCTQAELAEEIGISRRQVAYLEDENDKRGVTARTEKQIVRAVKDKRDYLLKWINDIDNFLKGYENNA